MMLHSQWHLATLSRKQKHNPKTQYCIPLKKYINNIIYDIEFIDSLGLNHTTQMRICQRFVSKRQGAKGRSGWDASLVAKKAAGPVFPPWPLVEYVACVAWKGDQKCKSMESSTELMRITEKKRYIKSKMMMMMMMMMTTTTTTMMIVITITATIVLLMMTMLLFLFLFLFLLLLLLLLLLLRIMTMTMTTTTTMMLTACFHITLRQHNTEVHLVSHLPSPLRPSEFRIGTPEKQ